MALKGYLIVDPECHQACEAAVETIKELTGAGEVEVLEASQALLRGLDLSDVEGVPVVLIYSEVTGKRLNVFHFFDEEGKVLAQVVPSIPQEGQDTPA